MGMTLHSQKGGGNFINLEWVFPICHYLKNLDLPNCCFEVILPIVISGCGTAFYVYKNLALRAASIFADRMQSVISVLIGFTILFITLVVSGNGEFVDTLRQNRTKNGKLTLFSYLLVQFVFSLIVEIALLLLIFTYFYLRPIGLSMWFHATFLFASTFMTLNIVSLILHGMTNLYFLFHSGKTETSK